VSGSLELSRLSPDGPHISLSLSRSPGRDAAARVRMQVAPLKRHDGEAKLQALLHARCEHHEIGTLHTLGQIER